MANVFFKDPFVFRLRAWLVCVALFFFTLFLLLLCVLLFQFSATTRNVERELLSLIRHTSDQVDVIGPTILKAGDEAIETIGTIRGPVDELSHTLFLINHPCDPGPCGTLADVNKTLNTARDTMGMVEIAAFHEDRNLGELDTQERSLFADVHETLGSANGTLLAAHTTVDAVHELAADPNLPLTLAHVQTSTASLDHMLMTTDAVETKLTNPFLHPKHRSFFAQFWGVAKPLLTPSIQLGAVLSR